jgi:hypothetical protein
MAKKGCFANDDDSDKFFIRDYFFRPKNFCNFISIKFG